MHKIIKNYQAKILNGITMIVPRVIRQDRQIQCITSFFFSCLWEVYVSPYVVV